MTNFTDAYRIAIMNPRLPKPLNPHAALFMVGAHDDQDGVEYFHELWRQHCAATLGLPKAGSVAPRGRDLVNAMDHPYHPFHIHPTSGSVEAAKVQLRKALANVSAGRRKTA